MSPIISVEKLDLQGCWSAVDNDSTRAPQSSARTGLVICGVTSCILLNELVEEVKGVGVSAPYRPNYGAITINRHYCPLTRCGTSLKLALPHTPGHTEAVKL